MLQGGDPNGNGTGGPGYTVVGTVPGRVPLQDRRRRDGEDRRLEPSGTAGSQFFVISGAAGSAAPDRLRAARARGRHGVARDDQAHRALRGRPESSVPVEADLHLDGEARLGLAYPGPCARSSSSTSPASPRARSRR